MPLLDGRRARQRAPTLPLSLGTAASNPDGTGGTQTAPLLSLLRRGGFFCAALPWRSTGDKKAVTCHTPVVSDGPSLLFRVAHAFDIAGRGCVLLPEAAGPGLDLSGIPRGRILLRRPDGTETQATFVREYMLVRREGRHVDIPALLATKIAKSDVPVGTEVWLVAMS